MKTLLCLVVISVMVVYCLTLDCPGCDLSACKDPGPCRFGKTKDVCACCPVCYKGVGEECGGPWNVKGVCADHLTCVRLHNKDA
ncbi:hypothetical protein X975_06451, partial [Stegodyphus mimosarum]